MFRDFLHDQGPRHGARIVGRAHHRRDLRRKNLGGEPGRGRSGISLYAALGLLTRPPTVMADPNFCARTLLRSRSAQLRSRLNGCRSSAKSPPCSRFAQVRHSSGRTRATLVRTVRSAVAPFVQRIWSAQWRIPAGEHRVQPILPHPSANLVLGRGTADILGVVTRAAIQPLEGVGSAFGAKLQPGALRAFRVEAAVPDS